MAILINRLQKFFKSDNNSYHLLLALKFAGVLPFLLLALLLHTTWLSQTKILEILFAYAAVILTFLGGIQWGIGIMRLEDKTQTFPHIFTLSILPSLAAWLLVLLHYPKLQLIGFILSFIFVLSVDIGLTLQKIIPSWFLKLRLTITLLVILLLLLSYFAL